MYGIMWLIAIIVFLILEAVTYQFICIWFAGGALGALIACGLGAGLTVQITVFFLLSALLLVCTRPFVKKLTFGKITKTNVDDVPGKLAQVIEKIDNVAATGRVKLGAMEWAARSEDDSVIEIGEIVEAIEVSGVKLIVKKHIGKED